MDLRTPTMRPPPRNKTFRPTQEPLRRTTTMHLDSDKVQGPVSFLNPTRAQFTQAQAAPQSGQRGITFASEANSASSSRPNDFGPPQPSLTYMWTSRNSRKGRHTLLVSDSDIEDDDLATPPRTAHSKQVLKNIGRMFTCFPIGDLTYDVALTFVIGSAIWVLNSFFVLLPLTNKHSTFPGEVLYAGGISAFIGVVVFEIGCALLLLEAINADRTSCFG